MNDNIKLVMSKNQLYHAGIVVLVIIISLMSGYELGKKWGRSHPKQESDQIDENEYFTQNGENDANFEKSSISVENQAPEKESGKNEKEKVTEKSDESKESSGSADSGSNKESGSEKFVASRNGTKFYPAGCKSAERIKTENKVY